MDCEICLCGGFRDEKGKELTTEEALKLCEQIAEMKVKCVVLTGGEPLIRDDWDQIASRLSEGGVEVQIITNASLITPDIIERMKKAGIQRVSVSIDGTREIHDAERIEGSFAKCESALALLKAAGIPTFVATTVTAKNFGNLSALKSELERMGVEHWGIQLGMPYGNFTAHAQDVLPPDKLMELIDFCYETSREGKMYIYPGENIGYYTCKEAIVRSRALHTEKVPVFSGCPAGISTLNIAYEGTILGMSMCVSGFLEGNIRKRTLREIWEDENSFAWRRKLKKEDLKGACGNCEYGDVCLGGCPAVRYAIQKDICEENPYCAYRLFKEGGTARNL
jgi:radical SAM protein with 4Fe4S-binding SPASM domain